MPTEVDAWADAKPLAGTVEPSGGLEGQGEGAPAEPPIEGVSREVMTGAAIGAVVGSLIGGNAKGGAAKVMANAVVGSLIGGGLGYVAEVRRRLGLTVAQFARAINVGERTVRNYERPDHALTEAQLRPVRELDRLREALAGLVDPAEIGPWLNRPNDQFEGFRPIELIERGQTDRLWRMIYVMESGSPC